MSLWRQPGRDGDFHFREEKPETKEASASQMLAEGQGRNRCCWLSVHLRGWLDSCAVGVSLFVSLLWAEGTENLVSEKLRFQDSFTASPLAAPGGTPWGNAGNHRTREEGRRLCASGGVPPNLCRVWTAHAFTQTCLRSNGRHVSEVCKSYLKLGFPSCS